MRRVRTADLPENPGKGVFVTGPLIPGALLAAALAGFLAAWRLSHR